MSDTNSNTESNTSRKISIHCHPFEFESKNHIVEKSGSDGIRHHYLRGISSGLKLDGTGERMTENCINSMHEQGKTGNVLLYEGNHGIDPNDDLGILVDSDITPAGDWITEYRTYDDSDGNIADINKQRSRQLVAQLKGLPPYKKPAQRGFSIEGVVPEHEILSKTINDDGSYSKRVINYIQLDGVLVVPRPAYQDSVVTAVYKCLGELPPPVSNKLQSEFEECFKSIQNSNDDYYKGYFEIQDRLYDEINKIMRIDDPRNTERLNILFNVHKSALTGLIFQNERIFKSNPIEAGSISLKDDNQEKIDEVRKTLQKQLGEMSLMLRRRIYIGGKLHGKKQISKQYCK